MAEQAPANQNAAPATAELNSDNKGPLGIPRSELRQIIERHNSTHDSNPNLTNLASLEKAILVDEGRALENHLEGLEGMPAEDYDKIISYISELDNARNDESKWDAVYDYLDRDLNDRREELANLARNDINKFFRSPGHKQDYAKAQATYNESLRTYNRWDALDIEDKKADELERLGRGISEDDKQRVENEYTAAKLERATDLALTEMRLLREAVNDFDEPEENKGRLRSKMRELADKEYTFGEKRFGKNKGEKRRISLGAITLLATSGVAGGVWRAGVAASSVASAGLITGLIGTGGAIIGATKSAYVANRVKADLGDAAENEAEAMRQALPVGAGEVTADKLLTPYLTSEKDKARKGRGLGRAALRGAGIGFVSAFTGSVVGVAAADLIEKIPWNGWGSGERPTTRIAGSAEEAPAEGADTEAESESGGPITSLIENMQEKFDELTSNGDTEGSDFDDAVDPNDSSFHNEADGETAAETPTVDQILEHYAENPVTIESGEGPFATMEKLGITDPDMKQALYDNPDVKAALMERGLIYDVGDGSGAWGWSTTGELSVDDVRSIFENVNLDSLSGDSGIDIPASYDADLQALAESHPIVTEIPSGMGGEQLMRELDLPAEAWYAIEGDLQQGDFYRMSDGHMGLSHPGALSPDGFRELVEELDKHGYTLAA